MYGIGIDAGLPRKRLHVQDMLQPLLDQTSSGGKNIQAQLRLQQIKEGYTHMKLGIIVRNFWREILQQALQDLDATLSNLIDVAIGLALLPLNLALHRLHLLKATQRRVEHLVVERK